jgi:hypothetical protein
MDRGSRSFYEMKFERDFLRKKGSAFQDWFAELMERRYPDGDFMRVRPWGSTGDRKSDGYLRSQRMLFQCYAPNEMKEAQALGKINDDFYGALPHWQDYCDTWVLVHNSREGLGPGITKRLLDLDAEHDDLSVRSWGFNELRRVVLELSDEDLRSFLGPAPTSRDFLSLGFEDLKVVLEAIKRQAAPPLPDIERVPREKARINRLSEDTESLIALGRRKSVLVGRFLQQYPDPKYGDETIETFKLRYQELRDAGLTPDRIFLELQVFAGGEVTQEPKHQAAVLAVLAYLFDQCDIFEPKMSGSAG